MSLSFKNYLFTSPNIRQKCITLLSVFDIRTMEPAWKIVCKSNFRLTSRTIVSLKLGISIRNVNLKALDKAYSIAFPNSTPINISKK